MRTDSFFENIRHLTQDLLPPALPLDPTTESASTILVDPASPFMIGLTVFVLACFVGYYVVWKVTPALHSPLMAVTNAISSVIIVGALIASASPLSVSSQVFGVIGVLLASINIVGGFTVTDRMLKMFKK